MLLPRSFLRMTSCGSPHHWFGLSFLTHAAQVLLLLPMLLCLRATLSRDVLLCGGVLSTIQYTPHSTQQKSLMHHHHIRSHTTSPTPHLAITLTIASYYHSRTMKQLNVMSLGYRTALSRYVYRDCFSECSFCSVLLLCSHFSIFVLHKVIIYLLIL